MLWSERTQVPRLEHYPGLLGIQPFEMAARNSMLVK
jgi:hypothetical protein